MRSRKPVMEYEERLKLFLDRFVLRNVRQHEFHASPFHHGGTRVDFLFLSIGPTNRKLLLSTRPFDFPLRLPSVSVTATASSAYLYDAKGIASSLA
jgi:hypothetical protein